MVKFTLTSLGLFFSGSLTALIFAYGIKFCALSQSIFGESLAGVTPSLDASGRNLGHYNFRILKNIYLPILNKEIIACFFKSTKFYAISKNKCC